MEDILNNLEEEGGDCVVSITVIPRFCISDNDSLGDERMLGNSNEPASMTFEIEKDISTIKFQGYTPKNKKLFTSPYLKLIVVQYIY